MPIFSEIREHLIRFCRRTLEPFLSVVSPNDPLRKPRLKEVLVIGLSALGEGHEDGAGIEKPERKRDAVCVEVTDDSNDVAGTDAAQPWIIGLRSLFDLSETQRFRRTDEKWPLAISLTPSELVEQSPHSYAPPT
jgi:hypothetical protein